ncbi:MAG: LOG family protein [Spirulina sp. SIO3F2]|nr:LOG family protein [Spirulina sp. SIO3F2]
MVSPSSASDHQQLVIDLAEVLDKVSGLPHRKYLERAIAVLMRLAPADIERLDWKILTASLEDMERGIRLFHPYRHIRKVSIFGSARTPADKPIYQMAMDFAQRMAQRGFMVITGAGDGIMAAGNEGAGCERSFGLNIQLPFEQGANAFIEGDEKLISFKYFFTRKLFFLRESDAIALFPGGFGTLDEAFESLTLSQTGKYGPAPIVFINESGSDYWHSLDAHIREHLLREGLISPDDPSIYTITDDLDLACAVIHRFYRVYHSSRYVGNQLVLRLKTALPPTVIEFLNREFNDLLTQGEITPSQALPEELGDETEALPRLVLEFNQKDAARLLQMINKINELGAFALGQEHPEWK